MVAAGKECQFGLNWAARMVNLAVAVDQVGSRIGIKVGCNWPEPYESSCNALCWV